MAYRTTYDPISVQCRMLEIRRQLESDLQELRLLDHELDRIERQLTALQRSLRGERAEAGHRCARARAFAESSSTWPGPWGPH